MTAIGQKVRRLRGDTPYEKVGQAVGFSTNAIRDLEIGNTEKPSVQLAAGVARYFAVPLDWLADDSADWPPPQSDAQQAVEMVRSALAREGLAGELDKDERDLLAAWRTLSDADRTWILGYVTGLAAGGTEVTADEAAAVANRAAEVVRRHKEPAAKKARPA